MCEFFWFGKKRPELIVLALFVFLLACRTSKVPVSNINPPAKAGTVPARVVSHARNYLGTPYKLGGNDQKGIDCSGLTTICYKQEGITLPRIAKDQVNSGREVSQGNIQMGDLVFFDFSKNKNKGIGHVGLVSRVNNNIVFFIHASSSKGVIESNLNESYYKNGFVKAVRPNQH